MVLSKKATAIVTFFVLAFNVQANENSSLLFSGNCITCHFETKTVSAPSVVDFKQQYMMAFPIKEDFIEYMSIWVEDPKEESSLMLDSVKKHGLMPKLGFDKETLRAIATYIYETDFTKKHAGH
ncbi:MAG: cytochrome C [Campylobacterales bacterium]|nr:cytochrome C [Campylobacterales bacterium]